MFHNGSYGRFRLCDCIGMILFFLILCHYFSVICKKNLEKG